MQEKSDLLQQDDYIITEKQLNEELEKIKELANKVRSILARAEYSSSWIQEYENAIMEYENAKNELFKRMQTRRSD